jgi:hypothetical protein
MSEIRVRNDTGESLDEVRVVLAKSPQRPILVGPVLPGAVSDWHTVPTVHRYPAIEASGPNTDLVHLPYEGTTQPAMPEGRYTYVLRLESGRLVVELEAEAN